MAYRLIGEQLFDNNGEPLNGGKVYVYAPGTTTEKDSYPTADDADAGTNENANPVVLDSAGRGQVWGKSGENYKIVIKTSADVTLATIDDIEGTLSNPLKVYSASGTADAITVTLDPNPGAWSTDVSFYFRPSDANTGSATININGLGAKTLKLPDASTNLPAGYLQTSNVYGVWYDGTNAVIVSAPSIIESGNNSNGYYVRYADGTQECTFANTTTSTTSIAAGNIFASAVVTWAFPKAFSANPKVFGDCYEITGNAFAVRAAESLGTTSVQYRVYGVANTDTGKANMLAIGRWY